MYAVRVAIIDALVRVPAVCLDLAEAVAVDHHASAAGAVVIELGPSAVAVPLVQVRPILGQDVRMQIDFQDCVVAQVQAVYQIRTNSETLFAIRMKRGQACSVENLSLAACTNWLAGGPISKPPGVSRASAEDSAWPSHAWRGIQQGKPVPFLLKHHRGAALTAHTYHTRRREMGFMAVTHNIMILRPIKLFLQGTPDPFFARFVRSGLTSVCGNGIF